MKLETEFCCCQSAEFRLRRVTRYEMFITRYTIAKDAMENHLAEENQYDSFPILGSHYEIIKFRPPARQNGRFEDSSEWNMLNVYLPTLTLRRRARESKVQQIKLLSRLIAFCAISSRPICSLLGRGTVGQ